MQTLSFHKIRDRQTLSFHKIRDCLFSWCSEMEISFSEDLEIEPKLVRSNKDKLL